MPAPIPERRREFQTLPPPAQVLSIDGSARDPSIVVILIFLIRLLARGVAAQQVEQRDVPRQFRTFLEPTP